MGLICRRSYLIRAENTRRSATIQEVGRIFKRCRHFWEDTSISCVEVDRRIKSVVPSV
jgi:hypothetical protein